MWPVGRRLLGIATTAALVVSLQPVAHAGPTCRGREATIVGTDAAETLRSEPGAADVILARGGDDVVIAGDRDDVVCGNEGNDDIRGGSGNDLLVGGPGNDVIRGRGGYDTLNGSTGDDRLFGGLDRDNIVYLGSADGMHIDLTGGTTRELDVVDAVGDGADVLSGIEVVDGSRFDDVIIGNEETNRLSGYDGADLLDGRGGADQLKGGADGDGGDTVGYGASSTRVLVDLATGRGRVGDMVDSLVSIENAVGSALDDRLLGDGAANSLKGGRGNDLLEGRGGPDVLGGGRGKDTVSYASASARVQVDLAAGTAAVGSRQVDALISLENLRGSQMRDVVFGTRRANLLIGNGGDDELNGRAGPDVLKGRGGRDVLNGQKGDDRLVGGKGNDQLDGGSGRNECVGGAGTDTLRGCP